MLTKCIKERICLVLFICSQLRDLFCLSLLSCVASLLLLSAKVLLCSCHKLFSFSIAFMVFVWISFAQAVCESPASFFFVYLTYL